MNINPAQVIAECERAENHAAELQLWSDFIEKYMAEPEVPALLKAIAALLIKRARFDSVGLKQQSAAHRAIVQASQSAIVVPGVKH